MTHPVTPDDHPISYLNLKIRDDKSSDHESGSGYMREIISRFESGPEKWRVKLMNVHDGHPSF